MNENEILITVEPEIWKDIPGFEGFYKVSTLGRIQSAKRPSTKGKILKQGITTKGYNKVTLCTNGVTLSRETHRFVGLTFIPNPENKPCINHINGIKTDNSVENLEWCTQQENVQHAFRTGLMSFKNREPVKNFGSANGHSRKIAQFDLSGNKIKEFDCATQAAKETGLCNVAIRQAAKRNNGSKNRGKAGGYRWKFLAECNYIVKRNAA